MAVREFIFCTGVLLLVGFFQSTVGLKCYSCILCNDPFDARGLATVTVADNAGYSCSKIVVETLGIVRNVTQNCVSGNAASLGSVSCCQTDLCNSAPVKSSITALMVALIVGFIILFK